MATPQEDARNYPASYWLSLFEPPEDTESLPGGRDPTERLPLSALSEDILGVTVAKVIIPVAAGRNLAVLVEAAVRNQILKLRGIDSMAEFMARQQSALDNDRDED